MCIRDSFTSASVVGYIVEDSIDAGASWNIVYTSNASVAASYTVNGLTQGTPYQFKVAFFYVVNNTTAVQTSAYSVPVAITTLLLPVAPTAPQVSVSGTSATISWTASTSTGITGYQVVGSTGTTLCQTSSTSCVLTNLAPGTYTVHIVAQSANGVSPALAVTPFTITAPVVIKTAPKAPVISVSSPKARTIVITLKKPVTPGTSKVLYYQYSFNGGAWHRVAISKSGTFTLKYVYAGRTYSVRLRAVSAVGPGASSAPAKVLVI